MTCDIVAYVIPIYPSHMGSVSVCAATCRTHNWQFPVGQPPGAIHCPIGRIEQATEDALAQIRAEREKGA